MGKSMSEARTAAGRCSCLQAAGEEQVGLLELRHAVALMVCVLQRQQDQGRAEELTCAHPHCWLAMSTILPRARLLLLPPTQQYSTHTPQLNLVLRALAAVRPASLRQLQ